MEKHRYYYYYDECNDDFANNGIDGHDTPADYEYFPSNLLYKYSKPILNHLMLLFLTVVNAFTDGFRIHNLKVLKNRRDKKKGYFVFGNHTTWIGDAVVMPAIAFPREVYTVVHPDAISIKGASTAIRMLGAMPNPSSRTTYVRFMKAAEKMYNECKPIVVYPEAHIWPKYNKIRNFPDVSFNLPVRFGAPCYVKSTVYSRNSKGYTKADVWFDGPFYPNPDLSPKDAQRDLRDRVYAQMCERCKNSELDIRYHYVKVDSPEEVRTEIKEI